MFDGLIIMKLKSTSISVVRWKLERFSSRTERNLPRRVYEKVCKRFRYEFIAYRKITQRNNQNWIQIPKSKFVIVMSVDDNFSSAVSKLIKVESELY